MATTASPIYEHAALPAVNLRGARVAWGGVWSGILVGIGVFLLLSTLGLAIGISAAEVGPGEDSNARLGTGALIWSGLTLLFSLFVGGMVATRSGLIDDKATGMIEGALVWVLSILAIIYMASSGISMLANSASGIFGGLAQGAKSAVGTVDLTSLSHGDVDQMVARLNDPATVKMVATAIGAPEAEARSMLADIQQKVEAARTDPAQAAAAARQGLEQITARASERVERAAAAAQPYASRTAWITLGAMLLSLLAAVGGAMTGRRQAAKRLTNV